MLEMLKISISFERVIETNRQDFQSAHEDCSKSLWEALNHRVIILS